MARLPASSFFGALTDAIAGPTMIAQSESNCAVAGARLRNAGLVRAGTSPAMPRGPLNRGGSAGLSGLAALVRTGLCRTPHNSSTGMI